MQAGQLLSDAAFAGDIQRIETLLATGIHVDTKDNDGFTALHRSCVTGNVKVIEFLISRKANVNIEDSVSGAEFSRRLNCTFFPANRMRIGRCCSVLPSSNAMKPAI